MKTCSDCYFALHCSELCEMKHKKRRCMLQIRQCFIMNNQNEFNTNYMMKEILENYRYSGHKYSNFIRKSKTSMIANLNPYHNKQKRYTVKSEKNDERTSYFSLSLSTSKISSSTKLNMSSSSMKSNGSFSSKNYLLLYLA